MSGPAYLYRGDHGHLKFPLLPTENGYLRMGRYWEPGYADGGQYEPDAVGPGTFHPFGIPLADWRTLWDWYWRVAKWKIVASAAVDITHTYAPPSTWTPYGTYTASATLPTTMAPDGTTNDSWWWNNSKTVASLHSEASLVCGNQSVVAASYYVRDPVETEHWVGTPEEGCYEMTAGVLCAVGAYCDFRLSDVLFFDGKLWPFFEIEAQCTAGQTEDSAEWVYVRSLYPDSETQATENLTWEGGYLGGGSATLEPVTIAVSGISCPGYFKPRSHHPSADAFELTATCTMSMSDVGLIPHEYWTYGGRYDPTTGEPV